MASVAETCKEAHGRTVPILFYTFSALSPATSRVSPAPTSSLCPCCSCGAFYCESALELSHPSVVALASASFFSQASLCENGRSATSLPLFPLSSEAGGSLARSSPRCASIVAPIALTFVRCVAVITRRRRAYLRTRYNSVIKVTAHVTQHAFRLLLLYSLAVAARSTTSTVNL